MATEQKISSLTYTLPSNVKPTDIGGLIGKGAQGLKKTIKDAWQMYEQVQKSKNKIEEDKPTIRIVLKETEEEKVEVEIISPSETMRKLAQLSMDNHLKSFVSTKKLQSYTFVAEMPHHLLGQLIGKKASGLQRLLQDAIYPNERGKHQKDNPLIDASDIDTALTARIRINELKFTTVKDLSEFVKKRHNTNFIGWPLEEDDEYTDHISITVTFDPKAKPFKEYEIYQERVRDVVSERLEAIKQTDTDRMDEINQALGYSD